MGARSMDDAARKLGERLLAKAQLTQAEIKSAVAEARDERAVEVEFERVKRLAWRLYGVTRLNAGKQRASARPRGRITSSFFKAWVESDRGSFPG
jgi:hypothetical protein